MRNWTRPLYSKPALITPHVYQNYLDELELHYSVARFKDDKYEMANARFIYGSFTVDLKTGEAKTEDFGPLMEVYSSTVRSPKDPNLMFGTFNRLAKFDVKQQKLLKAVPLDHTYYSLGLNKAGSKVYVAGGYSDIAVYDSESLERLGGVKLPGGDMGMSGMQVFTR
ncbi:quinohemoprotein amine dehydrogenase, beta subunit [compost metagenome]